MLNTWAAQLAASAGKSKWRTVLLMGILGGSGLGPDLFSDQLARATAFELLLLTASEVGLSLQIAAVELLARGWRVWRKHIGEPMPFFRRLLALACVNEEYIAGTASQALQSVLIAAPTETLTSLRALFALRVLDAASYNCALGAICAAMASKPELFVEGLHLVAEMCVHVLDSKQAALRSACLRAASQAVQSMLRIYPMVSLHQVRSDTHTHTHTQLTLHRRRSV